MSPADPGYSTVGGKVPLPPPPSANGYSKIGPKTKATTKKRATGYSEVLPKKSVNGVVVEDIDNSGIPGKIFLLKEGNEKDKVKSETKSVPEDSDMSR